MGRDKITSRKITPKSGDGRGLSDAYIFTKRSHLKSINSCESQRNIIEIIATSSSS
ncbi:hypothetical protein [uncultured Arcticibacterium sp.]|uniref:hypothetical protein n=1 Tax=uncultured Arcticibacterium sp. TaxID=2173042 RepID=UPI0030F9DAF9